MFDQRYFGIYVIQYQISCKVSLVQCVMRILLNNQIISLVNVREKQEEQCSFHQSIIKLKQVVLLQSQAVKN